MSSMLCFVAHADPRIKQINHALQKYGRSFQWMADRLKELYGEGPSLQTVANILNGVTKNPHNRAIFDQMIEVLRIESTTFDAIPLEPRGFVRIAVYPGISAGAPGYDVTDVDYEEVPDWGGERQRWGRVVMGDSMMPVFRPGDIVIIEDRPPHPGLVVQAFRDGDDVLKCWREVQGRQEIWSFNDDYLPIPADGWAVRGVAVGRIRYHGKHVRLFLDCPNGVTWNDRNQEF